MAHAGEPRWGGTDVLVALMIGYGGSALASLVVVGLGGWADAGAAPGWALLIVQLPLWAAMAGVPVLATRSRGDGPVRDLRLAWSWIDLPIGIVAGCGAQLVLLPVLYAPLRRWIPDGELEKPARDLAEQFPGSWSKVLFVLMVVVIAPVTEEVLYRGLLLRWLDRRWGHVAALVGSAVIFGALHFQAVQTLGLVAFGLVAAALVLWTDRLGTSMVAHATFNAVTVIVLLRS